MSLSIAVVVLTTAVITGFKNEITDKIFGFWGHIDISHQAIKRNYEAIPIDRDGSYIDSIKAIDYVQRELFVEGSQGDKLKTVSSNAGVEHVQSVCLIPGIIKTKDDFESIIIKGIGKDFDWSNLEQFIDQGRRIEFPVSSSSDDILISEVTAKRLKLSVDQNVIVTFLKEKTQIPRKFKVSGIYKTGLQEYDKRFALADIKEVQQIFGWEDNQVMGMEVFLEDIDDLNLINDHIYIDVLPGSMDSQTVRDKFPAIFSWLELQNINEYVIITLMIIVAIINMITTLLILILEHSQMVGVMKSLGSTNWSIRKIFLYHGWHIIKWGLIIGNVVGIALALIQKKFKVVKLNEENYYLDSAPIELVFSHILLLNMGAVLIILCFLIIPTFLINRISPVKVLHFK